VTGDNEAMKPRPKPKTTSGYMKALDLITHDSPDLTEMSEAALMLNHANATRELDKAIHAYDLKNAWKWTKTVVDIECEFIRRRR
jgi:hypothetical protein